MRQDMASVIIDRPRRGAGDGGKSIPPKGTKRRESKIPLDEKPKRGRMGRGFYGWDCKELNEHLAPLYRYLRSNVGRPWDKVWSEICANLSVRNATTSHVRDHVEMDVEKNVIMVGKTPCRIDGTPLWREFYVNPNSGLLCRVKDKPKHRYEKKKPEYVNVGGKLCQEVNGIWYEITFKNLPKARKVAKRYPWLRGTSKDRIMGYVDDNEDYYDDVVYGRCMRRQLSEYWGEQVRADSKKQLNKREIKKLGLR
jgi:hypothetical protein